MLIHITNRPILFVMVLGFSIFTMTSMTFSQSCLWHPRISPISHTAWGWVWFRFEMCLLSQKHGKEFFSPRMLFLTEPPPEKIHVPTPQYPTIEIGIGFWHSESWNSSLILGTRVTTWVAKTYWVHKTLRMIFQHIWNSTNVEQHIRSTRVKLVHGQ